MSNVPTVVGLGEILWDLLPSGRQLGGAPANFAYWSHILGNRAVVASRVGNDDLAHEIRKRLAKFGISDEFIQLDSLHPTGTVRVQIDSFGQPKFEIIEPVAWDFLEWTDSWQVLAGSAAAVCFGSLAQRSPESQNTIRNFLNATSSSALRILDVNLRQDFYSADIIRDSLERANIVKMNHDEVPVVKKLLSIAADTDSSFCCSLIQRFQLKVACITHGAGGSLLCDGNVCHEHNGFEVTVRDTVGAGDAFTAALVHGLLQGRPLAELNESANRLGAWVASQPGGMPPVPASGLENALAALT